MCFNPVFGLDLDCAFALNFDLVRDLATNSNSDRTQEFTAALGRVLARARARAHELTFESDHDITCKFIRAYLSTFLTILELLIEIYEQRLKSQRQIFRNKRKTQQYNYDKDDLIQQFNTTADAYIAFAIIHLRQENKLPAWESIRIVREED